MVLSKAGACLTAAMTLAFAGDGATQTPPQSPPAQSQTQPAAGPRSQEERAAAQPQSQSTRPEDRRQSRKKRQPRASARGAALVGRESRDVTRVSRVAGPTNQGLMLISNLLGGYDDNLAAGMGIGAGSAGVPTATAAGSAGTLDTTLLFRRTNNLRSLVVLLFGDLRGYPGHLRHPAPGGYADAKFSTRVGRDQRLWVSGMVRSEPSFTVFSPAVTSGQSPSAFVETTPAGELFERRSLTSFTHVETDRRLGRRGSASVSYRYQVTQYPERVGVDNRTHQVQTRLRATVTQGIKARGEYQYIDRTMFDRATLSMREHRVECGPEIEKALSHGRYLRLWSGVGASFVSWTGAIGRPPYSAWVRTGSASATLGLSPVWSVESGYRRAFSVLPGVTEDVYATDSAYVTTGWLVGGRLDIRAGATYSNWRTPLASGVSDRFDVFGGSLQLGMPITSKLSATAAYFYYYHRYSNPAELPEAFPAKYDRHAIRVGLTLRLRLAGKAQTFGTVGSPQR